MTGRSNFLVVAALVAVIPMLAACGAKRAAGPSARTTTAPPAGQTATSPKTTAPIPSQTAPLTTANLPRGTSLVAATRVRRLAVYRRPGRRPPFLFLAAKTAHGETATYLVERTSGSWVRIALARRPNGSSGWVKRSDVTLLLDYYRLKIDLTAHRLTLLFRGRVVRRLPIGVGKALTPTPAGIYFVVELLKTPDSLGPYGPYAFGLSAYSTVLTHFGAGGKGEIGLHGTNEPQLLGKNVSHGCIRISNEGVTRLAKILPLGTPVEILR
jgi:lipoprotein-anchoring transpeptidase ErfK/SrfK